MRPDPSWALRSACHRRGDRSDEPAVDTDTSTIRAYAATGYLPHGTELHGRRYWPRHVVQARIDAGDQRHHMTNEVLSVTPSTTTRQTEIPAVGGDAGSRPGRFDAATEACLAGIDRDAQDRKSVV